MRTCSVTGCALTLVKPLGFSVSNKWLKRAGLDYWEGVDIAMIDDLVCYLEQLQTPFYFFSRHAQKLYTEVQYESDCHLIFGSETTGLAPIFWEKWPAHFYKIPMKPKSRCLNLANSVSVVVYEGIRQTNALA